MALEFLPLLEPLPGVQPRITRDRCVAPSLSYGLDSAWSSGRITACSVALSAILYFTVPLNNRHRESSRREWTILREQIELPYLKYYIKIVIPGTAQDLLGGYRLTVALAFAMSVASEYLGAQTGLGKIIDSARITFNVPGIFLAVIVAALLGVALDLDRPPPSPMAGTVGWKCSQGLISDRTEILQRS